MQPIDRTLAPRLRAHPISHDHRSFPYTHSGQTKGSPDEGFHSIVICSELQRLRHRAGRESDPQTTDESNCDTKIRIALTKVPPRMIADPPETQLENGRD